MSMAVACFIMGNHVMNLMESSDTSPVVDKEKVVTNITDTLRLCSPMNNQTVSVPSLLEIPWDTSLVTVAAVKALVMYGVAVHFVLGITMVDKSGEGKRTPLVLAFLLMTHTWASFIETVSSPLFTNEIGSYTDGESGWLGSWNKGWIPLGLTSLFLAFVLCLVIPSSVSKRAISLSRQLPPATPNNIYQATTTGDVSSQFETDRDEEYTSDDEIEDIARETSELNLRDFVNSSWSLLKNKIFLCNGLSALFILAGLLGINQIQTILSAIPEFVDSTDTEDSMRNHSNHSLPRILVKYSGLVNAIGPSICLLVTGWLIFKSQPTARKLVTWNIMCLVFMLVFVTIFTRDLIQLDDRKLKVSLHSTHECSCDTSMKHLPVAPLCSSDGIVFGSPCQAGCQEMCTGPNRTQLFTNCSLLTNSSAVLSSDQCPDSTLVHLIGFQYIFTVVQSLVITCPLISLFINLRCVVKKVRPLSLGLLTCLTTLMSSFNADTFYAKHITEFTCLALLSTCVTCYFIKHFPLYPITGKTTTRLPSLPRSPTRKLKASSNVEEEPSVNTSLPRDSVDEAALLDLKILSKQRDSIDVTRIHMKRLRKGKRFSLDYRRPSLAVTDEHVVYP
ncbi:hypothetical protein M8J76_011518 [Diaphorina citri]|nr:hypothetical protein M8J76_011518 [Diaphorina citri]